MPHPRGIVSVCSPCDGASGLQKRLRQATLLSGLLLPVGLPVPMPYHFSDMPAPAQGTNSGVTQGGGRNDSLRHGSNKRGEKSSLGAISCAHTMRGAGLCRDCSLAGGQVWCLRVFAVRNVCWIRWVVTGNHSSRTWYNEAQAPSLGYPVPRTWPRSYFG